MDSRAVKAWFAMSSRGIIQATSKHRQARWRASVAYQFPPDVDRFVKERIASGNYASEDDVLRDAMTALEQIEQDRLARWDERNRLAVEQSKLGLSKPLDDERVLTRLRERLAQEGIIG